mmetsp:Transcript_58368/g.109252  ORF Transcript_58368/g.109252 Transcript_58368/m.109252 type:complete len:270 (+) Transcript_58368:258-1067(+)
MTLLKKLEHRRTLLVFDLYRTVHAPAPNLKLTRTRIETNAPSQRKRTGLPAKGSGVLPVLRAAEGSRHDTLGVVDLRRGTGRGHAPNLRKTRRSETDDPDQERRIGLRARGNGTPPVLKIANGSRRGVTPKPRPRLAKHRPWLPPKQSQLQRLQSQHQLCRLQRSCGRHCSEMLRSRLKRNLQCSQSSLRHQSSRSVCRRSHRLWTGGGDLKQSLLRRWSAPCRSLVLILLFGLMQESWLRQSQLRKPCTIRAIGRCREKLPRFWSNVL